MRCANEHHVVMYSCSPSLSSAQAVYEALMWGRFWDHVCAHALLSHHVLICSSFSGFWMGTHAVLALRPRLELTGKAEIEAQRAEVAALAEAAAEAQKEAAEREGDIRRLRAQREAQSSGQVKALGARADDLSKK